eukprot:gene8635-10629_t
MANNNFKLQKEKDILYDISKMQGDFDVVKVFQNYGELNYSPHIRLTLEINLKDRVDGNGNFIQPRTINEFVMQETKRLETIGKSFPKEESIITSGQQVNYSNSGVEQPVNFYWHGRVSTQEQENRIELLARQAKAAIESYGVLSKFGFKNLGTINGRLEIVSSFLIPQEFRIQWKQFKREIEMGSVVFHSDLARPSRRIQEQEELLEFYREKRVFMVIGVFHPYKSSLWINFKNENNPTVYIVNSKNETDFTVDYSEFLLDLKEFGEFSINLSQQHSLYTKRYYQMKDMIGNGKQVPIRLIFYRLFSKIGENITILVISRTSNGMGQGDGNSQEIQKELQNGFLVEAHFYVSHSNTAPHIYVDRDGTNQERNLDETCECIIWEETKLKLEIKPKLLIETTSLCRAFRCDVFLKQYKAVFIDTGKVMLLVSFPPLKLLVHSILKNPNQLFQNILDIGHFTGSVPLEVSTIEKLMTTLDQETLFKLKVYSKYLGKVAELYRHYDFSKQKEKLPVLLFPFPVSTEFELYFIEDARNGRLFRKFSHIYNGYSNSSVQVETSIPNTTTYRNVVRKAFETSLFSTNEEISKLVDQQIEQFEKNNPDFLLNGNSNSMVDKSEKLHFIKNTRFHYHQELLEQLISFLKNGRINDDEVIELDQIAKHFKSQHLINSRLLYESEKSKNVKDSAEMITVLDHHIRETTTKSIGEDQIWLSMVTESELNKSNAIQLYQYNGYDSNIGYFRFETNFMGEFTTKLLLFLPLDPSSINSKIELKSSSIIQYIGSQKISTDELSRKYKFDKTKIQIVHKSLRWLCGYFFSSDFYVRPNADTVEIQKKLNFLKESFKISFMTLFIDIFKRDQQYYRQLFPKILPWLKILDESDPQLKELLLFKDSKCNTLNYQEFVQLQSSKGNSPYYITLFSLNPFPKYFPINTIQVPRFFHPLPPSIVPIHIFESINSYQKCKQGGNHLFCFHSVELQNKFLKQNGHLNDKNLQLFSKNPFCLCFLLPDPLFHIEKFEKELYSKIPFTKPIVRFNSSQNQQHIYILFVKDSDSYFKVLNMATDPYTSDDEEYYDDDEPIFINTFYPKSEKLFTWHLFVSALLLIAFTGLLHIRLSQVYMGPWITIFFPLITFFGLVSYTLTKYFLGKVQSDEDYLSRIKIYTPTVLISALILLAMVSLYTEPYFPIILVFIPLFCIVVYCILLVILNNHFSKRIPPITHHSIGDGKCVVCDSHVKLVTVVRICDECNYGSFQGRCVVCGGPGVSDGYYCKECTIQEKDRDGCPKIINLGSSKTDLFYERKKYGFKKR